MLQRKILLSKPISRGLESAIDGRENVIATSDDKKFIIISSEDTEEYKSQIVSPIISEGDAIGSVIIMTKDAKIKFGEMEQKLAQSASSFLGKQMEA